MKYKKLFLNWESYTNLLNSMKLKMLVIDLMSKKLNSKIYKRKFKKKKNHVAEIIIIYYMLKH